MPRRFALWIGAVLLLIPASVRADDLTAKINAAIHGPDYKHAHWGILVVDTKTGEVVYAHNPDSLCVPASVTKLYSCAAALLALGPDHRFETPVYRRGEIKDGKLTGDLILVASGDPTLGGRTDDTGQLVFKDDDHTYANSPTAKAELTNTDPLAGLKALARQVKEAGIREITGDVLIDDRLFVKSRGSGSGPDLLTPIIVNDNVVDIVITPGAKPGMPAVVTTRPSTDLIRIDARVETVEEGKPLLVRLEPAGEHAFTVRGFIAVGSKSVVKMVPVSDPTAFARTLFIDCLRQEGVAVTASGLRRPEAELPERNAVAKLPRVAVFTSPPLSEVIKVTLKVSHNLYASTLPILAAVKHNQRTLADGLHLQRKFLQSVGVDVTTISFAGGAGGMNADSVTPRATVQLLQAMAKRPEWKAYHAGFPILGVDGTLATVLPKDSPALGKAQGKTGTLSWQDVMNERSLLRSKALAGVMTTKAGRELTFAMFVNNVPHPKGVTAQREGKLLARLCEIIHENVQ